MKVWPAAHVEGGMIQLVTSIFEPGHRGWQPEEETSARLLLYAHQQILRFAKSSDTVTLSALEFDTLARYTVRLQEEAQALARANEQLAGDAQRVQVMVADLKEQLEAAKNGSKNKVKT